MYESSESKFITQKLKMITDNPGDSIQCYALIIFCIIDIIEIIAIIYIIEIDRFIHKNNHLKLAKWYQLINRNNYYLH